MGDLNKFCVFCNTSQPITNFIKNKNCSLGLNNKCKSCQKLYRSNYNKNNKTKILEYNLEYNKTYNLEWAADNKHVIKWRNMLHIVLKHKGKKKNTKTEIMLGYSLSEFTKHIEDQFSKDMNWNNIHIDHKIPLTWFKIEAPIPLVNHLENLHPTSPNYNYSKLNSYSDKISYDYFVLIKEWILDKYIDKVHF